MAGLSQPPLLSMKDIDSDLIKAYLETLERKDWEQLQNEVKDPLVQTVLNPLLRSLEASRCEGAEAEPFRQQLIHLVIRNPVLRRATVSRLRQQLDIRLHQITREYLRA